MTRNDYIKIFTDSHKGFFEREYIKKIPKETVYEEMFMKLADFVPDSVTIDVPSNVSFGFYEGSIDKLKEAVALVDTSWGAFFNEGDGVYCGYVDGEIASFCLVEDMGTHLINGVEIKVGGPGCVGTVPKFRKQGIGLEMVKQATAILKERGYDYSYIHYTGVAPWYRKLGYRTEICWSGTGIIE